MEYENDIFISYSHLDNEPLFDDPGWISSFHHALEVRVAQLLGKRPRIWRDPDLKGNDVFPETLSEQIRKAASLICVLSPRYVESDWCQRELREFAGGGARMTVNGDTRARVFKVVTTELPIERHPQPVRPLLGYEFYKVDPETRRVRELDVSIDPTTKPDYWARLDDLAHDIRDLLESADEARIDDDGDTGTGKGAVYLAETSLDLQDERDAVRRELLRHGYSVLPDRSLPLAADQLMELVREQTGRARLAIHLVGGNYGVVPEGSSKSIVELQNEAAAERAGNGLQRLIWIPPELEVRDERQQAFLEALRDDERTYVASDLLEVPLEDLKTHVHDQLESIERGLESAPAAGETAQIYLICDQRDADGDAVAAIDDFLFERGFEVVLPQLEGDEEQVRRDHAENLISSDAFLFYYGAGTGQWIRHQLKELEKSRGYPDKRRELATAVYVAGPPSREKRRFRTHLAPIVIRERDGFDDADLAPLLREIERARTILNG